MWWKFSSLLKNTDFSLLIFLSWCKIKEFFNFLSWLYFALSSNQVFVTFCSQKVTKKLLWFLRRFASSCRRKQPKLKLKHSLLKKFQCIYLCFNFTSIAAKIINRNPQHFCWVYPSVNPQHVAKKNLNGLKLSCLRKELQCE